MERLTSVATFTSLDAEHFPPWHLKLDLTFFDPKGAPSDKGTIEEWWRSPEVSRVVYDTPDFKATELRTAAGSFHTDGAGSPPPLLAAMLKEFVHPMPLESEFRDSTPELRKQTFGKVPLECVMLSQPIPARMPAQEVPLGLFPTYCFDPGTDSLRLSYDFGSQDIVRNAIGHFANRSVASSITINDGGLKLATGQILLLRTEPAPEPEIESTEGLVPLSNGRARVAGGVIAGSILNKVTPRYPESAKERHVSGMVTMKAIIGRDGHIRNLRVIKCPDTDLAIAALAAVRHWTYKPYLLNGQPTEVDTTITVNFAFGPG